MAFVNLVNNSKAQGNFAYQGAMVAGVPVTPHLEAETRCTALHQPYAGCRPVIHIGNFGGAPPFLHFKGAVK
jgi:hypothetical protein